MAKEPKTKKAGEEKKTSKKKRTVKPVARVSSKRQARKKAASKKKGTKTASKAAGKKAAGKTNAAPSKKTKKTGKAKNAKKAPRKTPAKKTKRTPPKKQNRKAKKVSIPGKVSKPSARKKQAIAAKKKATREGRKAPRRPRGGTKNAPLVISGPKRDNSPLALTNNIAEAVMLEREITNPDWQAVAHFNSTPGRPFTLFTCDMIVPKAPLRHIGQTIIIFIGLQSFTENRIIQPILQWGRSQMKGGGKFWSVGSCLAKGQFVLEEETDLIKVEPGTHLRSVINATPTAGGNFRYSCFFESEDITGLEGNTRIDTPSIPELKNCCVTLEATLIESRENYPSAPLIVATNIEVRSKNQDITPDWQLEGSSQHGEQVTADQDQVELRF